MNKRFLAGATLVAMASVAVGGCTRMKNTQGYVVDEQLISSIQPGVDNKGSVMQTLGRPSLTSNFDDRQWYYVSRQTKQLAFLRPKPTGQTVLIVSFDQAGNVTNVERRGMEKVASIDPTDDKTPTLGRESGLFEDLFGNIGRVGAPAGSAPPQ